MLLLFFLIAPGLSLCLLKIRLKCYCLRLSLSLQNTTGRVSRSCAPLQINAKINIFGQSITKIYIFFKKVNFYPMFHIFKLKNTFLSVSFCHRGVVCELACRLVGPQFSFMLGWIFFFIGPTSTGVNPHLEKCVPGSFSRKMGGGGTGTGTPILNTVVKTLLHTPTACRCHRTYSFYQNFSLQFILVYSGVKELIN